MRRMIVVVAAIAAVAGAPAQAGVRTEYSDLYARVAKEHGKRAPGRNIVKFGLANGKRPSKAQVLKSIDVLRRMMQPAPVVSTPSTPSVGAAYAGGVPAELESIAQCESGGSYTAVNSSSGAYGKYQILPSTAEAHGCDLSTPAGQDQCAVEIYAGGAGRGQWVC